MRFGIVALLCAIAFSSQAAAYQIEPLPATGQELRYERGEAMVVSRASGTTVRVLPHANGPHGRIMFTVLVFNQTTASFNFGYENVAISNDKGPVRLFTLEDMKREALKSARWKAAAVVMAAGLQSYSAAQNTTYSSSGTVYGPRGQMATFNSSGSAYNPALNSIAQSQINNQAAGNMAAISAGLDNYMGEISNRVLLISTVDPNTGNGGTVFADRPEYGKNEDRTVKVVVRAGPDTHEFTFLVKD